MSISATAVDNANGTATVTISGSDSLGLNTFYSVPVSQGPAPVSWVSRGTRTGDGTITVTAMAALYYGYVQGLVGGISTPSPPFIFSISASALAVQEQVEAAILARCQTLTLAAGPGSPGIPPALAASQMQRINDLTPGTLALMQAFPALVVAPGHKQGETQEGLSNNMDDLGLPVAVVLLYKTAEREPGIAATLKLWRQQIFSAIRWQPLAGVPTCMTVKPEPGPILDYHPDIGLLLYSGITFRAVCRLPRG